MLIWAIENKPFPFLARGILDEKMVIWAIPLLFAFFAFKAIDVVTGSEDLTVAVFFELDFFKLFFGQAIDLDCKNTIIT